MWFFPFSLENEEKQVRGTQQCWKQEQQQKWRMCQSLGDYKKSFRLL